MPKEVAVDYLVEMRSEDDSAEKISILKNFFGNNVYPLSQYYFMLELDRELINKDIEEIRRKIKEFPDCSVRIYKLEEILSCSSLLLINSF